MLPNWSITSAECCTLVKGFLEQWASRYKLLSDVINSLSENFELISGCLKKGWLACHKFPIRLPEGFLEGIL